MDLLLLVPLGNLIYADFRERRIWIVDLILFGALQLMFAVMKDSWGVVCYRLQANILVLLWLLGAVCGYFLLKSGGKIGILVKVAGIGDLLFCLLLMPAFGLIGYLIFLTSAIFLTLCAWVFYVLCRCRRVTIPLVAGIGITYTCLLFIQFFCYG